MGFGQDSHLSIWTQASKNTYIWIAWKTDSLKVVNRAPQEPHLSMCYSIFWGLSES